VRLRPDIRFCTAADGANWCEQLAKRHRYIAYDSRGCGLSDRQVHELSLDVFVADLEAVVDGLGLERQGRREPQPRRPHLLLRVDVAVRAPLSRAPRTGSRRAGGEARLRDVVVRKGGFSRFRRAAETPFNLILEARP